MLHHSSDSVEWSDIFQVKSTNTQQMYTYLQYNAAASENHEHTQKQLFLRHNRLDKARKQLLRMLRKNFSDVSFHALSAQIPYQARQSLSEQGTADSAPRTLSTSNLHTRLCKCTKCWVVTNFLLQFMLQIETLNSAPWQVEDLSPLFTGSEVCNLASPTAACSCASAY